MLQQLKIIRAATLEELETLVNKWYTEAHHDGLEVDYLGSVEQLPDGTFFYAIDFSEPVDPEEAEHHG